MQYDTVGKMIWQSSFFTLLSYFFPLHKFLHKSTIEKKPKIAKPHMIQLATIALSLLLLFIRKQTSKLPGFANQRFHKKKHTHWSVHHMLKSNIYIQTSFKCRERRCAKLLREAECRPLSWCPWRTWSVWHNYTSTNISRASAKNGKICILYSKLNSSIVGFTSFITP